MHPSGGTDSSFAEAAPTLEVQQAIRHAVRVSQGRALPSKTTIIAPNPALLSPPTQASSSLPVPGPSGAFTLGVRRAIAAACKQVKGGVVPLCHSPCRSRPAPVQLASPMSQPQQCRSGQLPREQVWAKLPLSPPCPSRGSSLRCLCLQGEPGGNLGKSLMRRGLPPRHNFGKPTASSLGRGNGLPQSVSLCQREIHCAEGPSPA